VTQPIATIIAGALIGVLIAAAIMLTNHWALVVDPDTSGPTTALRLNRWTGTVVICGGARPNWEMPCPTEFPLPHRK
jgi:hypothetical protein